MNASYKKATGKKATDKGFPLGILVTLVILVCLSSLNIGAYPLSASQLLKTLGAPFATNLQGTSEFAQQIIWQVRLPRILMAFIAGAGLSLCGAALQGVFRNPLVGPHIIGVSAGAAFGGALAILLGLGQLGLLGSTFCFGMLALALVFALAHLLGTQDGLVVILAGVILSGFFGALVSLVQFMADTEEVLPNIVFWLLGSVATANWHKLLLMFVPCGLAGVILLRLSWRINILSMGKSDAQALDPYAQISRWLVLVLCAIIIASQVAVSGNIGWVGLVVPHLARLWCGADHRRLLPMSMLLGGGFMVLVDDAARTLTQGEVPLGILTALLGTLLIVLLLCFERHKALA